MTAFVIQLLSVIFVTLIVGSIQSVTADHLEPDIGIFKDKTEVELVTYTDVVTRQWTILRVLN